MPTDKPRIYLTLEPDLADAIRRIGLGAQMSQSAVVAAMLQEQRHALFSLADAMDKARQIQGPLRLAMRALLANEEQELSTMEAEAMGKLDNLHLVLDEALERQGEEVSARRPQGASAGASAPPPGAIQPPIKNKGAKLGERSGRGIK